jgi:DNA-binding MarR family transcriptional regulator
MKERNSIRKDQKSEPARSAIGRDNLKKSDMQEIIELLRATPRSSKEIMDAIGISSSVFKNRIDKLMERGEVESYEDDTDRRRTHYRIKSKEKAEASRGIYLATQFLESFKDPSYDERTTDEKGYRITMSAFFEGEEEKAKLEHMVNNTFENEELLRRMGEIILKLSKINKFAFVYAIERTGKQSKG